MNASVTMRQAGQSKKMVKARLSFFPFLKCVYFFLAPPVDVHVLQCSAADQLSERTNAPNYY